MVAFQAYRRPLVTVSEFKYLGRVLTDLDDNCLAVVGNLKKDRKPLAQMSQVLGQEGADPRTSGKFYKAVVQITLLLSAES